MVKLAFWSIFRGVGIPSKLNKLIQLEILLKCIKWVEWVVYSIWVNWHTRIRSCIWMHYKLERSKFVAKVHKNKSSLGFDRLCQNLWFWQTRKSQCFMSNLVFDILLKINVFIGCAMPCYTLFYVFNSYHTILHMFIFTMIYKNLEFVMSCYRHFKNVVAPH